MEKERISDLADGIAVSIFLKAIHKNSGNWAAAARQFGLHRSNLHKLAGRLRVKLRCCGL